MTNAIQKNFYAAIALLGAVLLIVGAALFVAPRPVLSQSSATSIAGYAWSDNIGWIDLSCSNAGVCGTNPFGLSVNGSGIISGYAWSDNIGWISANSSDLIGCPSGSCTATLNGGVLSGWLKALSADNNGWDGWISLNGSGYGPTVANGMFTGYAWGSDVIGWISFANAYTPCSVPTYYTCTGANNQTITQNVTATNCQVTSTQTQTTCATPGYCLATLPGSPVCQYPAAQAQATGGQTGDLTIRPSLIPKNGHVKIYWNIINVKNCEVKGSNGDDWIETTSGPSGESSAAIQQQTNYTLSCTPDDPNAPPFTETAMVNIVPTYQER